MLLTEWAWSPSLPVEPPVRRVLEDRFDATIRMGSGPDEFIVRPGGVVGSVTVGQTAVTVRPKIDIDRVLFMVAYARDPYGWQDHISTIGSVDSLVDGMASLFVRACAPLTARGLLRDYRAVNMDDRVVRGKVAWPIQARRLLPVPIALRHHVHDDDTTENRILRAACQVLRRHHVSPRVAPELARLWNILRNLGTLPMPADAADKVRWTRRNAHYRPAVELAGVILRGQMADVVAGDVAVQGFTLVMHDVFEQFVRTALRNAWGASEIDMPDSWKGGQLTLDQANRVRLNPDLGWSPHGGWRFVGDAKYKKDDSGTGRSPDIYQALAYAVATRLPEATLFYGEGGDDRDHVIHEVDKVVRVRHLDLAQSPRQLVAQLRGIARESVLAPTYRNASLRPTQG
ncbi:McrC family protein [Ornithinimicrobium panacihumi]|uniref:McrC family protein n=1 Tax=Ornithinimicrobium panacihumi TaxID=2008449 RepID=UPI003F887EFE